MKKKRNVLLIVTSVMLILPLSASKKFNLKDPVRIEKNINTEWVFNYFPDEKADRKGFEATDFDDSKWSTIAIPHTWMTYETTGELHPYIKNVATKDSPYWWNGWGWYRKRIVIGNELKDKKIFFEFDGVQKYSKIYLNGKLLGDHKGGFSSFYMDATDAVKFGEENILSVAVNNALNDKYKIPPMNAGNWAVYGGIVRDVRLVIKNKVFVPFQGSYKHEGGTFVTTPEVSEKEGVVNVKTFVKNEQTSKLQVTLKTTITKADNTVIAVMESISSVNPGKIFTFEQQSEKIKKPTLWSPENPYIYNVYSQVFVGNELVDTYYSPLGFRYFHWDYTTNRFWLNGKEVQIKGQNRHEEFPWVGSAFPKWVALRDMHDIRYNLEHNMMRTAHYTHDKSIYNFSDRNGLVINQELPNIKNQEFSDEVQEQNCREMIRRDRNHPSIFFWSMGNETTDAADSKWAYEEDKTRIITSRHIYNNSVGDFAPHSEKNMSIEGFLRCTVRGWYDTDDRDLEPTDVQHAGTEVNDVNRALERNVQKHYGSVWLYADHGADREYLNAPLKHVNPKGWVDSWRTPKYKYYLWQANFASKPMVFIHYHNWRAKYMGQKRNIMVHSNCDEVELFVNKKSLGKKALNAANQYTVVFEQVEVVNGKIEAIGTRKDGSKANYSINMAGEPAKVILTATRTKAPAGLHEIVEIKANIVDKNNVPVIGANNMLKWTVTGPATLIGPENYISDRDQVEAYEGTMYIDAPVFNLIRSTGETGKVKVSVTSSNLQTGEIEVVFEKAADINTIKGILEPKVSPQGRLPVAKNTEQITRIIAPEEMKQYKRELNFPLTETDKLRANIEKFVLVQNPDINPQSVEIQLVVDKFYQLMYVTRNATDHRLVADDYNFVVEQYNICREITKQIATMELPQAYQDDMIKYYAELIIERGQDRNFLNEKNTIALIPSGGKVLLLNDKRKGVNGVIETKETDLIQILHTIYPETKEFSDANMKKALTLLTNINPSVSHTYVRDKKTKARTDYYTVSPDFVLYVPSPSDLLNTKFPDKKL